MRIGRGAKVRAIASGLLGVLALSWSVGRIWLFAPGLSSAVGVVTGVCLPWVGFRAIAHARVMGKPDPVWAGAAVISVALGLPGIAGVAGPWGAWSMAHFIAWWSGIGFGRMTAELIGWESAQSLDR